MLRFSRLLATEWTKMTQFTGDCYLQSMMGHGLSAASNEELVDKLVMRGFLLAPVEAVVRIKTVDRAAFLPPSVKQSHPVYSNNPLKIAQGHFMSTPQLHAQILSLLADKLGPGRTAMELGCGTGFLPAVFSALGCSGVYGIENHASLLKTGKDFASQTNVVMQDRVPQNTRFDAVYVSPYFESLQTFEEFLQSVQWSADAVCVAPVKLDAHRMDQQMLLVERNHDEWKRTDLFTVLCEPLAK